MNTSCLQSACIFFSKPEEGASKIEEFRVAKPTSVKPSIIFRRVHCKAPFNLFNQSHQKNEPVDSLGQVEEGRKKCPCSHQLWSFGLLLLVALTCANGVAVWVLLKKSDCANAAEKDLPIGAPTPAPTKEVKSNSGFSGKYKKL
eukprot:scaffold3086_cov75-Cylindrotheca_fusiformis.AAC.1